MHFFLHGNGGHVGGQLSIARSNTFCPPTWLPSPWHYHGMTSLAKPLLLPLVASRVISTHTLTMHTQLISDSLETSGSLRSGTHMMISLHLSPLDAFWRPSNLRGLVAFRGLRWNQWAITNSHLFSTSLSDFKSQLHYPHSYSGAHSSC